MSRWALSGASGLSVCFVVQVERSKANPLIVTGVFRFRASMRNNSGKRCVGRSGLYPKNTERMCSFNLEMLTMTLLDSVSRNRD
jgi:hypothetical protein